MAKDEEGVKDGQDRRLVKGAAVLQPCQVPADSHNRVEEAPAAEQDNDDDTLQVQGRFLGGNIDGIE